MSTSPFRSIQFMIPFSISWFVWMSVHLLALYYIGLNWVTALLDSIVSNMLLVLIAMLIFTMLRFYLPRKNGFINLIAWLVVLTAGWFFVSKWLLNYLFSSNLFYTNLLSESWPVRTAIAFLINGCCSLTAYVYYSWQEKAETEKQKSEIINISREAELYKLRQQLQPHFLFNSLNSINALIGVQPVEARTMVQQLSEFLRATLKKEENQWVLLSEEMHTIQLYLEIEKIRFGNRLSTIIDMPDDLLQTKIPAMLMQPLVENAIKFGLYNTTETAEISIRAEKRKELICITVSNSFDADTSSLNKGTGFGLSSVERRLFLLFSRSDLLQTEVEENVFSANVLIPQPIELIS